MKVRKLVLFFLLFPLMLGPLCHAQDPQATSPWSDGWYQGAVGYEKAVEEYRRTNQPMVVYMSVGWCPYCRKFEKEVLSQPLVQDFLKDKIKVNINPESGKRENSIAFQYGIRGFPSFFLHPPQPGRAMQLSTSVTPEEFIQSIQQASRGPDSA